VPIGIDIDPQALTASHNNALLNKVQDKLQVFDAEQYPRDTATHVIANILAEPLVTLAHDISNLVEKNGHLLLSGILTEQIEQVVNAYSDTFSFDPPLIKGEWACLHGCKKN